MWDGMVVWDYIYVLDVVWGYILVFGWNGDCGGIGFCVFNFGSGMGIIVFEVVWSFEVVLKRIVLLDWVGWRLGDVGVCVVFIEWVSKELGWLLWESVV